MARSTRCFGGKTSVTIPAGAPALSDPVVLTVPAMSDLAVSLYLPGTVPISTLHDVGLQTSYVSSPGDFTGSPRHAGAAQHKLVAVAD